MQHPIVSLFEILPVLSGPRLTLRAMTEAEAARLRDHLGPDQRDILPTPETAPAPDTVSEAAHRTTLHRLDPWAVVRNSDGRIIGACAFTRWHLDHARGTIAFAVEPLRERAPLLAEALRLVLRFGFEQMGLERVEAYTTPADTPTHEALASAGMHNEARLRGYIRAVDEPDAPARDVLLWAALRADEAPGSENERPA